jgi:hypothetical protein
MNEFLLLAALTGIGVCAHQMIRNGRPGRRLRSVAWAVVLVGILAGLVVAFPSFS